MTCRRLKLPGACVMEMAASPSWSVERVETVRHVGPRQLAVLVALLLDAFFLPTSKEDLGFPNASSCRQSTLCIRRDTFVPYAHTLCSEPRACGTDATPPLAPASPLRHFLSIAIC